MVESGHKHSNRLVSETSPYLLQHAHNPVDWYPWGEEALKRSAREDKPILLSVGYSSCHWCHVMERESFEDEGIARLMNENFVCIKVDREQRPDLDEIYMAATLALNRGQGGWPMTVFLTPEQKPFFAGTYFPPTDRWGRTGFTNLLTRLADAWKTDRERLVEGSVRVTELLREEGLEKRGRVIGQDEINRAVAELSQQFDERYGGFGPAPKFPPSTALSLLLRHHRRTGDGRSLDMVKKTLDAMARGGMYDQVGGGFARYSTDERWLVPHFEKMLYDNALLSGVYLEAFEVTRDPLYERICREVLDYVLREMVSEEGGFYSATDADSEGVEGKFFVWTPAEIREILSPEAAECFCDYYDIAERGNWEGRSIPNVPRPLQQVAEQRGMTVAALQAILEDSRDRVYEARLERVPPGLDDKILTGWNALMISSLAAGYRVLGDERYAGGALRAANFIRDKMTRSDGRLLRTYRRGKAQLGAYLEDYAYLCSALVDLYEAVLDADYLKRARAVAERVLEDFVDEETGAFFSTAKNHEKLILRPKEGRDGAIPSANAVAAEALARLAFYFDCEDFRRAAERAVIAYGKLIASAPRAFCRSLAVVDFLLEGPTELALVGRVGDEDFEALRKSVNELYLPNRIIAYRAPDDPDGAVLPLLRGRGLVDGKAALYVCRNFTCDPPVTKPADVVEALRESSITASRVRRSTLAGRLRGWATPEGTRAYMARLGRGDGSGQLGSTGLWCSRVGFGGYRVDDDREEHREALKKALLCGCNLIDTSTNYTEGNSERLVGEVLHDLVGSGRLFRQEIIVVSKIGYVQGTNLELARNRQAEGDPFPEMVRYVDECWHCIHPSYLEDQLGRSLERLQLETLDVCLLHNPEYYLIDAKNRGERRADSVRGEFYRRIREAFSYLEGEVNEGRIRWYGVSSNTAAARVDDLEATSLTRMLEIAREVAGEEHHFAVLQLPVNLVESDAVFNLNNGTTNEDTVLDHARKHGIAVLANRPLNAIVGRTLLRLVDFPAVLARVSYDQQLRCVEEIERRLRRTVAAGIRTFSGEALPMSRLFCWADEAPKIRARLDGYTAWQQIEAGTIRPQLHWMLQLLDAGLSGRLAEVWQEQRDAYLAELNKLFLELRRQATEKSQRQSDAVSRVIEELLPEARREEPLSRKVLWVAASTPGVSCVLNGMRQPFYVEEALGVLEWDRLDQVQRIYERVRGLCASGELFR